VAKEPLTHTYRLEDPQRATIIDWTVEPLIQAEEGREKQANLAEMKPR
jgi:hypothetical protein